MRYDSEFSNIAFYMGIIPFAMMVGLVLIVVAQRVGAF